MALVALFFVDFPRCFVLLVFDVGAFWRVQTTAISFAFLASIAVDVLLLPLGTGSFICVQLSVGDALGDTLLLLLLAPVHL